MRLQHSRAGNTTVTIIVAIILLVIGGFFYFQLKSELDRLDREGAELTAWATNTDGPDVNATGGLTTWLIDLKKHLNDHVNQQAHPNGPAHAPGGGPMHADPPPPPVW